MASEGLTVVDAVNMMLETVNEFPISTRPSADSDTTSIARRAEDILLRETKTVLSWGWPENTTIGKEYTSGAVDMSNVYAAKGSGRDAHRAFTIKDNKLWDVAAGSHTIQPMVSGDNVIYLDIIGSVSPAWPENFENGAMTTKEVIVRHAAQLFQRRLQGSQTQDAFLSQERAIADMQAKRNPIDVDPQLPNIQPLTGRGGGGGGGGQQQQGG